MRTVAARGAAINTLPTLATAPREHEDGFPGEERHLRSN